MIQEMRDSIMSKSHTKTREKNLFGLRLTENDKRWKIMGFIVYRFID